MLILMYLDYHCVVNNYYNNPHVLCAGHNMVLIFKKNIFSFEFSAVILYILNRGDGL